MYGKEEDGSIGIDGAIERRNNSCSAEINSSQGTAYRHVNRLTYTCLNHNTNIVTSRSIPPVRQAGVVYQEDGSSAVPAEHTLPVSIPSLSTFEFSEGSRLF